MTDPKSLSVSPAETAPGPTGSPEWWSAWMDGELETTRDAGPVSHWLQYEGARESWDVFHRIGDIMRSEDLSGRGAEDQWLVKWRERFAAELPLVAPQADLLERARSSTPVAQATTPPAITAATRTSNSRWALPLSIAAGVAMVTSAAWVSQGPGSRPEADLARQQASLTITPQLTSSAASQSTSSRNIQAVEFESYLAAHRQFQPATAQGPASGFLRSAVYESR